MTRPKLTPTERAELRRILTDHLRRFGAAMERNT